MKRIILPIIFFFSLCFSVQAKTAPRKVYMTYILHGNMNYDRYVRPTIWKEFPIIYDNLLTFMDEHPEFKGQLQFSGQTFGSLELAAPEVLRHAKKIHDRGQLNFTGTFYSEPVNVNMDGETNFLCAWLGTRIIEDNIGETDGFYLQERAYHPQLPWILNNANVSWTPVITNEESYYPHYLTGLDGSTSVCVPITRGDFIPVAERAPKNALIAIEEDYEIPQTFTEAYNKAQEFNSTHKDVQIEWITVKEYIRRFGIKQARYIDHTAKAGSPEKGTYSRWTADPLDIIVQNHTNEAMNAFRVANALDAIAAGCYGVQLDIPFEESGITLNHDALEWNIERAELYPQHEKYLQRDSRTTVLSKAEHLLLWAVNSDAKGWFPLYEKRRERINSLQNSVNLSMSVINKGLDMIGKYVKDNGYDNYYVALNMEAARKSIIEFESEQACEVYDVASGKQFRSVCVSDGNKTAVSAEVALPAYGYVVLGTKACTVKKEIWKDAQGIRNKDISLDVIDEKLILKTAHRNYEIYLDDFQIKALAQMECGKGDDEWRQSKQYGPTRIAVCEDGLYPRFRIERQVDYLVHMQQIFTLMEDRVCCEINFDFPHPTVIRKVFKNGKTNFRPEGLDLVVKAGEPCTVGYDIPFGVCELDRTEKSWFCPLSSGFLDFGGNGGIMLSTQTGEQAFSINPQQGEMTLFLGTSTTSGPIREMGLTMVEPTYAEHDTEWYCEPFHGSYHHKFVLYPFEGNWQDSHLPSIIRQAGQKAFVRRISASANENHLPYRMTVIENVPENVEVSGIWRKNNSVELHLNEREGRATTSEIKIGNNKYCIGLAPFGIGRYEVTPVK